MAKSRGEARYVELTTSGCEDLSVWYDVYKKQGRGLDFLRAKAQRRRKVGGGCTYLY